MKRFILAVMLIFAATSAWAVEWSQTKMLKGEDGARVEMTVTYYSAAQVAREVAQKAQENLWTEQEAEEYRYKLMTELKLDDYIPVKFAVKVSGPKLRMVPFDSQIELFLGSKKYEAVDYDKILNFPVEDHVEGLVFFPRYDKKGNDLLKDVKLAKIVIYPSCAPFVMKGKAEFLFNVSEDDKKLLEVGAAGGKLEFDRLLKRMEKLKTQKADLEAQLSKVNEELDKINARMDEIQKQ